MWMKYDISHTKGYERKGSRIEDDVPRRVSRAIRPMTETRKCKPKQPHQSHPDIITYILYLSQLIHAKCIYTFVVMARRRQQDIYI